MTAAESLTKSDLAALIDHTILKPETTLDQVEQVCAEALAEHVASVCVNPVWVPVVAQRLAGSDVLVCAVVGFPLGATTPAAVAAETREALEAGAQEIDMVAPLGLVLSGQWEEVRDYISAVREASRGAGLKVILETAVLEDEQIIRLCQISEEVGAEFVKTSTGFHPAGGATTHAVRLMRSSVGEGTGVKASGGIRDLATAQEMIDAGANRLGLSATVAILGELD